MYTVTGLLKTEKNNKKKKTEQIGEKSPPPTSTMIMKNRWRALSHAGGPTRRQYIIVIDPREIYSFHHAWCKNHRLPGFFNEK